MMNASKLSAGRTTGGAGSFAAGRLTDLVREKQEDYHGRLQKSV